MEGEAESAMNAGPEFLFWCVLFSMIGIGWGVHELVATVLKLKAARREIARLRAEVSRCRTWLHKNTDNWQVGAGRVRYPPKDLVIGN
ncbi:MAG: hypothetical protein V4457_06090 [Pseudomonadota bacterium]